MNWQCRDFSFQLNAPVIMGIVNVTPDSFSDGGEHDTPEQAYEHARRLLAEGADIIDVGGESTRPGSDEVAIDDELARVLPVVEKLAIDGVCVSVDTRHAHVAEVCIQAGAAIINDVSGFRDPAMVGVAAESNAGCVVMHMLGEPKSMQSEPHYDDVVLEITDYLLKQAKTIEAAGVSPERICIDPGPGFGKTYEHNLALLKATKHLSSLGYPLAAAWSRKRFIGGLTGVEQAQARIAGSVAVAVWAAAEGARILRVHDVRQTVQALSVLTALGAFA